jgi:hypothetical protein
MQPLDVAHDPIRIDIAHHGEERLRGLIKVPVEANEVVARQRAESRLPADAPASNAVPIVQQLVQRFGGDRGWVVSLPLRLLDDDLQLFAKLVGVDQRIGVGVELNLD